MMVSPASRISVMLWLISSAATDCSSLAAATWVLADVSSRRARLIESSCFFAAVIDEKLSSI
ncbi:Uncharacterised protein [Vibrio cholerae]|nr:Uncharacterised protein [Vibrio cholerae]CSB12924.1 Uncharacterised protein [Vibrio cholerae]